MSPPAADSKHRNVETCAAPGAVAACRTATRSAIQNAADGAPGSSAESIESLPQQRHMNHRRRKRYDLGDQKGRRRERQAGAHSTNSVRRQATGAPRLHRVGIGFLWIASASAKNEDCEIPSTTGCYDIYVKVSAQRLTGSINDTSRDCLSVTAQPAASMTTAIALFRRPLTSNTGSRTYHEKREYGKRPLLRY